MKKHQHLYLDDEIVKKVRKLLAQTVPKLSLSQKIEELLVQLLKKQPK